MKKLLTVFGIAVLLLTLTQVFVPADAQIGLVESRLARIETQLSIIQSQISQLSATRPRAGVSAPSPSASPSPSRPSRFTDAQFDRLATLVIESRDRIQALEEKVAKLEKR